MYHIILIHHFYKEARNFKRIFVEQNTLFFCKDDTLRKKKEKNIYVM